MYSLGWKGELFYVNSSTGWSRERLQQWAQWHRVQLAEDGSVQASALPSREAIVGAVALKYAVGSSGYNDPGTARRIGLEIGANSTWNGLPYVASWDALAAGIEEHKRRVSKTRSEIKLNYWNGPER